MPETIKIPKDVARELIDADCEGYEHVDDEHQEDRRWSALHYLIIRRKSDGKLFGTGYSTGLTDDSSEYPFKNDGPEIEFRELEIYQEVVTRYRVKK